VPGGTQPCNMALKSPHAAILALQLVKEQYGNLPEMVCRQLIKQGSQTLPELARSLPCSRQDLRQALLLLIQQNCVNVYLNVTEANLRGPASSAYMYEAAVGAICLNIRKPRFLMHLRDEAGELPELVLECLLENGRLRTQQVVALVASKMEVGVDSIRSEVVGAITSLVHAHYLERAPPSTLPVPEKKVFSAKVLSKAARAEAEMERSRREAPHAAYQKDRFRLPNDLYDYAETGSAEGKQQVQPGLETVGEKRAREAEEEATAADSVNSILWRANADEFNRRFRHTLCVELVKEKMDAESSLVVEAVLAVSRMSEGSVSESSTRPVNVTETRLALERRVGSAASEGEGGSSATIDAGAILQELSQDPLEMVSFSGDTAYGATYTVNMERIMDVVKLKEMEAVVRERFGIPALRVFRLLFQRHQLEQKQIAEMVMSPIKETREVLYNMLKAGFVALQEVPKTADHAPSRTFYLWRIDHHQSSTQLASELYKAAANLRMRFAVEQDREKEVLERLEASRPLSAVEHARLVRMKNVATVLDSSLLRLDELIAIFNDF